MTNQASPPVRQWRTAVFIVFTLAGLNMATWLGRVPTVRDTLHATPFDMGLLVVGMSVGSIAGLTAAGHVVTRFGARRGVQIASILFVVGLFTVGLAITAGWGFWGIWIALVAFGFGNGLCDVSMNVSGAAAEQAGKRTVMPLFHASFSIGTLCGAGIGAFAEAHAIPVLLHFTVVGVLSSAGILVAVRGFGNDRPQTHAVTGPDASRDALSAAPTSNTPAPVSRLAIWRQPSTLLIGLIVLGMALAEGSANDWLPLAVIDGHGVDNAAGSAILAVFVGAMTAGRVAGVVIIDRMGRVPVLRGSAVLAIIGMTMLIFGPNLTVAIIGVVLWGLGAALGFPIGMSAAADDPRVAAARVSAVATIGYVAFLAGPPVIGLAGDSVGLLHALLIVLVFIVVAGLAAGAARERRFPDTPQDAR